jgi:hypothetical protein
MTQPKLSRSHWWFRVKKAYKGPPSVLSYSFSKPIANVGINTQAFNVTVPDLSPLRNYRAKFTSVSASAGAPAPTLSHFTFWFYDGTWHAVTQATDLSGATGATVVPMPIIPAMLSYVIHYTIGKPIYVSVSKDVTEGNAASSPVLTWTYSLQLQ